MPDTPSELSTAPAAGDGLPKAGELVAERYRVCRWLSRGGMGMVAEGEHVGLGQAVALKFLLPSRLDHPQDVRRFLREARTLARVRNRHVVRVGDVGTLDCGIPYMVMDLLEGRDLEQTLEARGPLSVDEAVGIALQAADGLAAVHGRGLIHRDIKPSNLFLSSDPDGATTVTIIDFGIAKPVDDEGCVTTTGSVLGSPAYMSPEQVRDAKSVDVRTDVWSLGAVLYQMLAGEPPFCGDSAAALCAMVAADPHPPLETLRPEVSRGLSEVIDRCLEKRPDQRFAHVEALAEALSPHSSSRPRRVDHDAAPPSAPRAAETDGRTTAAIAAASAKRGTAGGDTRNPNPTAEPDHTAGPTDEMPRQATTGDATTADSTDDAPVDGGTARSVGEDTAARTRRSPLLWAAAATIAVAGLLWAADRDDAPSPTPSRAEDEAGTSEAPAARPPTTAEASAPAADGPRAITSAQPEDPVDADEPAGPSLAPQATTPQPRTRRRPPGGPKLDPLADRE